jgi:hypothetical protein
MRIPVWLVAATIIVMSLVTGVVLGVGIDRRLLWQHRLGDRPFFVTRFGGPHHVGIVPGHLERELGLSPAQSAAVDSITRHRMAQRDSLMAHTFPVMRALLDSTRSDIERVLTPAQRAKFEQLRFREPDGPPGIMMRRGDGEGGVIINSGR